MRPARLAHQRSDISHGRCADDGYPGASVTKGVTRDNAPVVPIGAPVIVRTNGPELGRAWSQVVVDAAGVEQLVE